MVRIVREVAYISDDQSCNPVIDSFITPTGNHKEGTRTYIYTYIHHNVTVVMPLEKLDCNRSPPRRAIVCLVLRKFHPPG
jgi:hypothetical protein